MYVAIISFLCQKYFYPTFDLISNGNLECLIGIYKYLKKLYTVYSDYTVLCVFAIEFIPSTDSLKFS